MLTPSEKRPSRIRFWMMISTTVVVLLFVVSSLRFAVQPSLDRSEIQTGLVEEGPIEATLSASGVIIPEFEQVITSSISARLVEVLKEVGTNVSLGDSILRLDKEYSRLSYAKLEEEGKLFQNQLSQERLKALAQGYDLKTRYKIKVLQMKALRQQFEATETLFKMGGEARAALDQDKLNLEIAKIELNQLHTQMKMDSLAAYKLFQEFSIKESIHTKNMTELGRKLKHADITSNCTGVVTWVKEDIGAMVAEGEEIVRVADLSSYKIKATISDSYSGRLKTGQKVMVTANNTRLSGTLVSINPTVENGIISFFVALDKKDDEALRSNLRVNIQVVTTTVNQVIRVKNGPAFKTGVNIPAFVISNGFAYPKTVQIGANSASYVELIGDFEPGDEVIISDMSAYSKYSKIKIDE